MNNPAEIFEIRSSDVDLAGKPAEKREVGWYQAFADGTTEGPFDSEKEVRGRFIIECRLYVELETIRLEDEIDFTEPDEDGWQRVVNPRRYQTEKEAEKEADSLFDSDCGYEYKVVELMGAIK